MVLSEIIGDWKFQLPLLDNTRFDDLLKELIRVHGDRLKPFLFEPDENTLAPHIMFMVNGRNIKFLDGKKTILQNGDQVTILLPAGGG